MSAAGPRSPVAAKLEGRLAVLAPTMLEIEDDSALHRAVLERVGDLIPHPVHALAIRAYAPDEFPSSRKD